MEKGGGNGVHKGIGAVVQRIPGCAGLFKEASRKTNSPKYEIFGYVPMFDKNICIFVAQEIVAYYVKWYSYISM